MGMCRRHQRAALAAAPSSSHTGLVCCTACFSLIVDVIILEL